MEQRPSKEWLIEEAAAIAAELRREQGRDRRTRLLLRCHSRPTAAGRLLPDPAAEDVRWPRNRL